MKQKFMSVLLLVIFCMAGLFLTGCPVTLGSLHFNKVITDQNQNVYEIDLMVNEEIHSAQFEVTIKDKTYSCGVNYEKNKDEPFSIQTDFSMYELTGNFVVGYKKVLTVCGVTNREEAEEIIKNSLIFRELVEHRVKQLTIENKLLEEKLKEVVEENPEEEKEEPVEETEEPVEATEDGSKSPE